jgi:hypothetical protein
MSKDYMRKYSRFYIKWKGFMLKAENTPTKVWLNIAIMLIALRLPEILKAIAALIHGNGGG